MSKNLVVLVDQHSYTTYVDFRSPLKLLVTVAGRALAESPSTSALRALEGDERALLRRLMHFDRHPNGDAVVLRADAHELRRHLGPPTHPRQRLFARHFLHTAFAERSPRRHPPHGGARCVLAVVHGAARHLPDLLDYFTARCFSA